MISSYPSIYTLGHRFITELFSGPVVIQEKIDGSQFSFSQIDGQLCCRSRGQQINLSDPGMFEAGVATARRAFASGNMVNEVIYRCEYLSKPKHNALTYGRVPYSNLVLFDVEMPGQIFGDSQAIAYWANEFGIEPVPVLLEGVIEPGFFNPDNYLNQESVLGGCKIEGVVVKNYNKFGPDKKILVGKFVSPAFKEVHRHEWRKSNPTQSDIVQQIIADYKTSPRWCKAVQHLRERGELLDAPQDIGKLIVEVQNDVLSEEENAIASRLFTHFWPDIRRGITAGLADWYKAKLAGENSFFGPQAGAHITEGQQNIVIGPDVDNSGIVRNIQNEIT